MADESAQAVEGGGAPKKSRKNMILGGIFLLVMALEAVVVVVLVKQFTPGPQGAEAGMVGDGVNGEEGTAIVKDVEVMVANLRARNDKTQSPVICEIDVVATVKEDQAEAFTELVARYGGRIKANFSAVVRSADAFVFDEPKYTTLAAKFKGELDALCKDDEIQVLEVVIPDFKLYSE